MKIIEYNKKGLINLLNDKSFWHKKYIPITKSKILHQIRNPNLSDEDILLFTIEESSLVICYLGAIPDIINLNGTIKKIFWLSTWWLAPEYSNTSNAALLYFNVWKKLSGQIAISSFSISAGQFYKKTNKFSHIPKKRHLILFNIDEDLFSQKFPKLHYFETLIKIIKLPFIITNKIKFNILSNKIEKIKIEYVNSIDQETWDFVKIFSKNDLIPKSQEFLDWKLSDCSNIVAPLSRYIENEYDFSAFVKNRSFKISYKIFLHNEIIAFCFFTVNKNNASLQFNYCSLEHIDIVSTILVLHILKLKVDSFFCEDDDVFNAIKKKRWLFIKSFIFEKDAIISKKIIENLNENYKKTKIHFGDGG